MPELIILGQSQPVVSNTFSSPLGHITATELFSGTNMRKICFLNGHPGSEIIWQLVRLHPTHPDCGGLVGCQRAIVECIGRVLVSCGLLLFPLYSILPLLAIDWGSLNCVEVTIEPLTLTMSHFLGTSYSLCVAMQKSLFNEQ